MSIYFIVFASLMVAAQPSHSPTALRLFFGQMERDSTKLRSFLSLSSVIESCQKKGDKIGESRAWLNLGICMNQETNYIVQILSCFNQALLLARQNNDWQQESITLLAMGEIHCIQGNLTLGEKEYLQAVAIQKSIGYKKIYQAYLQLTDLSTYRAEFDKALYYVLAAIRSEQASGHSHELDVAYYKLGNIFFELGQFDKCVEAYRNSLAVSRSKGQPIVHAGIAKKMARVLIKLGRAPEALLFLQNISRRNLPMIIQDKMSLAESTGECYAALKQYEKAEEYYLKSISLSKQTPVWQARVVYVGIGRFYVATKQYTKAGYYLRQLLMAPPGQVPLSILMEVHFMSYKVDSASSHYLAAMTHFRRYKALSDSIFSEARSRQLSALQTQYETGRKEQQIQLLIEKNRKNKSELQREKTTRNALLIGATLLIALLGLSYNSYRLKQQGNQQLQRQQITIAHKNESLQKLLEEKEWLVKEIHHRVKNNLQIITSLLHSQSVYLQDEVAQTAIRESRNRVHAMALLHQKLYQSDRLTQISMVDYITEIVDYLINSYDRKGTIDKQVNITPVDLDVALAVPIGLIINEIVTNSLKHAFPSSQQGIITIALTSSDSRHYQLIIGDNGIGMPPLNNPQKSRTLGMRLIQGLSKQIGAKLQITQTDGVQISLGFKTTERFKPGQVDQ